MTGIRVHRPGGAETSNVLVAGQIGVVRGLESARIGDPIGRWPTRTGDQFVRPSLETVVDPVDAADRVALYAALGQLAEQDPLIDVRQDDGRREVAVSLYGEVQKEVIGSLLETDYGVPVTFRESTPICVERLVGTGADAEVIGEAEQPVPRHGGATRRAGPAGSGRLGRSRGRARVDAARVLRRRRGVGARDAATGTARVGDPGLRCHHYPFGLLGAAQHRSRRLHQEHLQHRGGLPLPRAVGPDDGAGAGADDGLHPGAPVRAGDPRAPVRDGAGGPAAAVGDPAGDHAERRAPRGFGRAVPAVAVRPGCSSGFPVSPAAKGC